VAIWVKPVVTPGDKAGDIDIAGGVVVSAKETISIPCGTSSSLANRLTGVIVVKIIAKARKKASILPRILRTFIKKIPPLKCFGVSVSKTHKKNCGQKTILYKFLLW